MNSLSKMINEVKKEEAKEAVAHPEAPQPKKVKSKNSGIKVTLKRQMTEQKFKPIKK